MRALGTTAWRIQGVGVCVLSSLVWMGVGCGKKAEPEGEAKTEAKAPAEPDAAEPKPGKAEAPAEPDVEPASGLSLPVTMENVLYADGVKASLQGQGKMTLELSVTNLGERALRIRLQDALVIHPDPQYPLLRVSPPVPEGKKKKKKKAKPTVTVKPKAAETVEFEDVEMVRVVRPQDQMPPQPEMQRPQFDAQGNPLPPGQRQKKKKKAKVRGVLDELRSGQPFFGFAPVPKVKKKKSRRGRGTVPGEFGPPGSGEMSQDPAKRMIEEYAKLRDGEWKARLADLRTTDPVRLAGVLREILDAPAEVEKPGAEPARKKRKKKKEPRKLGDNPYLAVEARLRLVLAVMNAYPRGVAWIDDTRGLGALNAAQFGASWKLLTDEALDWALDKRWRRQQKRRIEQHVSGQLTSLTGVDLRKLSRTGPPTKFAELMDRCRRAQQAHSIVFGREAPALKDVKTEVNRYFPDCYERWAWREMKATRYGAVASLGAQSLGFITDVEGRKRISKTVANAGTEQKAKQLYEQAVAKAKSGDQNGALGTLEQAEKVGQTEYLARIKAKHTEVMDQSEKLAEDVFGEARKQQLAWHPVKAHQLYQEVVSKYPKTRTARRARGNMKYLREKFIDKAKALLAQAEKALKEEEFAKVRKHLHDLSVLGKDLPEVQQIEDLQKKMKEQIAKLSRQLRSKARRAELLHKYAEALKWYRRILKMDPHGEYSLQAQQKIQQLEAKVAE